jgi:tetratricopeptide (TPR) repeat protein
LVFEIFVSPRVILYVTVSACGIGLLGGLLPALRAAIHRNQKDLLMIRRVLILALTLLCGPFLAHADAPTPKIEDALAAIVRDFDAARFNTEGKDQQLQKLEELRSRAQQLSLQYPDRAEPVIWQGWALSEYGRINAGLSSLLTFKQARKKLEQGLALDPKVYSGKPHVTLGKLYLNLPRFPISFGNKDKAREHLRIGLSMDPQDPEANYSYAQLLFDDENYEEAMRHARSAAQAEHLPDRAEHDRSLQERVSKLIVQIQAKAPVQNKLGAAH